LADAIYAKPNNTYRFADVPKTGVKVSRGMTLDGIGKYLSQVVVKASGETDDIVGILKERKVDVVVSYLPVGSEDATRWYVEQVLQAGCAFVNCIPVFIGREPRWQKRFAAAKLPIIGDDIKSQVGATITHRVLTRLFMDRGVRLDRTYQLNFGGNTDFLNMLERERLESKKISKTNAVTSMLDYPLAEKDVHVGPSDYVPWLLDRKWCYIRMEGTTFGDVPLNAEVKLEVWDSPNSAGVVIDAIRCCKLALDRRLAKDNFAVVLDRPPGHREVAQVARRSFRNFAKYLVEIMRFPRLGANELERLVTVDPRSWAHLRSAREHGRGLIFVSMHFGNFEMGGARIADEMPLNVIADELENERLMDILVTNRKHKNLHLLPPNGAVRQVLQA